MLKYISENYNLNHNIRCIGKMRSSCGLFLFWLSKEAKCILLTYISLKHLLYGIPGIIAEPDQTPQNVATLIRPINYYPTTIKGKRSPYN